MLLRFLKATKPTKQAPKAARASKIYSGTTNRLVPVLVDADCELKFALPANAALII